MEESSYRRYRFFYFPSRFAEENLIVSDGMSYISSKAFLFDRATFDNNLVMYVVKGTLYVEQYGKKYTLTKSQGILMKLTDQHKYYSDKEDVAHVIWFHFRGACIQPVLNRLFEAGCLPIIFEDPGMEARIYTCFHITKERREDFEYQLSKEIYTIFIDLTGEKLRWIDRERQIKESWFTLRVRRLIDDNLYRRIDLDWLSARMNLSKYHFCRLFRNALEMPPMQYVQLQRIRLSKKLLAETDEKIESIASALYYSDQSHFSKTFKRLEGITPLQYRRMMRSDTDRGQ